MQTTYISIWIKGRNWQNSKLLLQKSKKSQGTEMHLHKTGGLKLIWRWGERKEDITVQPTIWASTSIISQHALLHEIQGRFANHFLRRRKKFHRRMTPHASSEAIARQKHVDAPVRLPGNADASAQYRRGQLLKNPWLQLLDFVVSGATDVIAQIQKY